MLKGQGEFLMGNRIRFSQTLCHIHANLFALASEKAAFARSLISASSPMM
jgi:hypothetical protein